MFSSNLLPIFFIGSWRLDSEYLIYIIILFRTEQRLSQVLVQIIQYLISYGQDFSFSINLLWNFSVFLFRLFSYSPFWQVLIIFKVCYQYVSQFSCSSYSDEFLTVLLNNCKRYSSFVINLINNSWKCSAFM